MKHAVLIAAVSIGLLVACITFQISEAAPARPNTPAPSGYVPALTAGSYTVEERLGVWTDQRPTGERAVLWRAFLPEASAGRAPVVIWSHGLGGSRDGSESLGRHLASHGYAAFHIQHAGTDTEALKTLGMEGLLSSLRDNSQVIRDRFRDVPFALDQITVMSESGWLSGRIDPERAGISGHSFGAITTLFIAGQRAQNQLMGSRFSDPRFMAAFAMSPSPPRNGSSGQAFADMQMPVFHLTGTEDSSPVGDLQPIDRRLPFDTIDDVDQALLILNEGTHFTFTDRSEFRDERLNYPSLGHHRELVRAAAVSYWDAYLKAYAVARNWLFEGGFATLVGSEGSVETRLTQ